MCGHAGPVGMDLEDLVDLEIEAAAAVGNEVELVLARDHGHPFEGHLEQVDGGDRVERESLGLHGRREAGIRLVERHDDLEGAGPSRA